MSQKIVDPEKVNLLDGIFTSVWPAFDIHLYKNDVTPDHESVIGDFTEADFGGYADQAASYVGATLNGSFEAEAEFTTLIFTPSGITPTQSVYGYYVTDGGGNLLWAERNPTGPVPIDTIGLPYVVKLRPTLTNNPAP